MKTDYRDFLIEAVQGLIESRDIIFNNTVNVAMSNELNELDKAFELGDKYVFDIKQFEDSNDVNFQKLVGLIKAIESTADSIININSISEEELKSTD